MRRPVSGSTNRQKSSFGWVSSAAVPVLLVLILIGVVYSLSAYFRLRSEVEAETIAADRAQVEMGAQFLSDFQARLLNRLTNTANQAFRKALAQDDMAGLEEALRSLIARTPELSAAALFGLQGKIMAAWAPNRPDLLKKLETVDWSGPMAEAASARVFVLHGPAESNRPPGSVICVPVKGADGQAAGLLAAYQPLEPWSSYFSRLTVRHGREYFILDDQGRLIVGSDPAGLPARIASLVRQKAGAAREPISELTGGEGETKSFVSAMTIDRLNWTFIIAHDYTAAMAPMRALMRNLVLFLALLFFCLTGLTLVIMATNRIQKQALADSADAARRLELLVKERTEDLARSTRRYKSLLEELPDVVYELNQEGRLTFVSQASVRLLGFEPEEMLGHFWEERVFEEDRPVFREQKFKAKDGGLLSIGALRHTTRQGELRWFSINSRGLFDDRGELIGRIGIARDVSSEIQDRDRIRQLSRRLILTQEEERKHLALDLHDEMGQLLSALKIGLQALPLNEQAAQGQQSEINRLIAMSQDIMNKVRALAYNLRPAVLDRFGLVPAIEDLTETLTGATKMAIDLDLAEIPEDDLSSEVKTTVFRFVQEALTNAVRYSGSATAEVSLSAGQGLVRAVVRDYGKGFAVDEVLSGTTKPHRLGLVGMGERLGLIGGRLDIASGPEGTTLSAEIPLRKEES